MKFLLVFDDHLDMDSLVSFYKDREVHKIDLFPLTSDPLIVHKIENLLNSQECSSISLLKSAQAIDEEVKNLRRRICKWSAGIGNWEIKAKNIRDWLLLPGCNVSTWWLSLLSEKNTLKTNAFFQIAQIRAVRSFLSKGEYGFCVIAVSDKNSREAIKLVADEHKIKKKVLSTGFLVRSEGMKSKIKAILHSFELFGSFLLGFFTWLQFIQRGIKVRRHLSKHAERLPESDSLLFVSYFPAVDKEAAHNGVFRNKYALSLQDKLKEKHVSVVWLLMPVPLDGYDFSDAIRLANDFANNGENLFILEEFLTLRGAIKGLFLWLRQIGLSWYLFHHVKKTRLVAEPVGSECMPIVKQLWGQSFCGSVGIGNILYCIIFKHVFKEIKHITNSLYYCEMQAWEKALIAAKNHTNPQTRIIGFQHSSVSRDNLSYLYDKTDTMRTGKSSDLPLPDVLACNGEHPYSLLSESGYSGLTQVESLRYLYLEKILSTQIPPRTGRPVLLIAGAYDRRETRALISLVYAAFPKAAQFDIWFKGHPSMPVEEIFKELGIDVSKTDYTILRDNVSEYFAQAWAMLVSTSTVSIEALAFGCEVIVPIFSDTMLINSLADCENYYHKVTCAEDLKETMGKIVDGHSLGGIDEYRQFVKSYWNIDSTLPRWTKLLNL
jgi:surface carbohydrate biosynthesis protein (TIGR04326 family)